MEINYAIKLNVFEHNTIRRTLISYNYFCNKDVG